MKTATKVLSGLFLASALMFGCSANFSGNFQSSETVETTDANGNVTATTTTYNNGKTETTSYSGTKKDLVFDNQTNFTFEEFEYKTNVDSEFEDMFDDVLEPGYNMTCSNVTVNDNVKTISFNIEDEEGNVFKFKDLDVSNLKDMKNPTFVFTQDGDDIYVNLVD